jgi:hypothetical protein
MTMGIARSSTSFAHDYAGWTLPAAILITSAAQVVASLQIAAALQVVDHQ